MARFQKGNPGKPKGAKHKRSLTRSKIAAILNDQGTWKKFVVELKMLRGRAYVDALTKLFEYDTPKYSSINLSLQSMPEEDLQYLLGRIREQLSYENGANQ